MLDRRGGRRGSASTIAASAGTASGGPESAFNPGAPGQIASRSGRNTSQPDGGAGPSRPRATHSRTSVPATSASPATPGSPRAMPEGREAAPPTASAPRTASTPQPKAPAAGELVRISGGLAAQVAWAGWILVSSPLTGPPRREDSGSTAFARWPMKLRVLLPLAAVAATASADQVFLKGGGSLSGQVVSRTAEAVTIEIPLGRVTLPASRVERIVDGSSPLGEYRSRALALRDDDAAGWLSLGLWAQDHGLHAQAREAFRRVLARDPGNAIAQEGLGNVRMGDRWVSPEESYLAQGLVYYDGSWVTREERDFALREREAAERTQAADRAR